MNLLSDPVSDIYEALEMEIIRIVARRLKYSGEATISEYHLRKMSQLHLLNRDVQEQLALATGISEILIEDSIKEAGYAVIDDTDEYMKMAGKTVLPTPSLEPLLESYVNQTFREMNNFVNQTLITTNFGEGVVAKEYQKIIEETTMKLSSGLMSIEQAVEDTVLQWADKGVPSTFIDKGGNTWSMERYTRTVLRSTNSRVYNDLRTTRMADYDVHTVLVGSKPKARNACIPCQGEVIDTRTPMQATSGFPSAYEFGYGRPEGHRGINCTHPWFPFVPGVSKNNQVQYSPKQTQINEEIEQRRKAIARRIVKTKKKLMVATELGSDKEAYFKKLLNGQQAQMRKFIEDNKGDTTFKLRRNYALEKVYTPLSVLVEEHNKGE